MTNLMGAAGRPATGSAEARTFQTSDGVNLVYRDSGGAGVPLLMLHGWMQSQDAFRHQFEELRSQRRVVTLDFRGHGRSDKPPHGYRIARLSADVADLLDHLQLAQVDALGWSLGVSVWWSFIELYGTRRMRSFVIVDQPSAITRMPWMDEQLLAESGAIWDLQTMASIVGRICAPNLPDPDERSFDGSYTGELDTLVLETLLSGARAAAPFQGGKLLFDHATKDWSDVFARIDIPTLVIGCEGSHVTPESQRSAARKIPGARVHVFSADIASSHFPFLQNPAAFNAVLDEFLS